MTDTTGSPQPPSRPSIRPPRSQWPVRLAALTPLWVLLVLVATRGMFWVTFFGPPPPEFLGIPNTVWLFMLSAVWMLLGLALVWDARSRLTQLIALVVFTTPALFVPLLGPAILLVLQNLS